MRFVPRCCRAAWLAFAFAIAFALASAAPFAQAQIPPPVREALQAAELPDTAFAMAVLPLNFKAPALRHRAEEPMQPGSTMKLVTSVVALERLGPNWRGSTQLMSAAPQLGEVLQGDLVLKGGADPELGVPQLLGLLAELRWAGIREIAGNLVLDRTLFRPTRIDQGLPPFDQAPEFAYNVIPDALMLNGNLLTLELASDADSVRVATQPPLPGLRIANHLQLNDRRCADWDDLPYWQTPITVLRDEGLTIELNGQFPRQCMRSPRLQLLDRTTLAELLVRRLWSDLGGRWDGHAVEGSAPDAARVLARRESRPWGEILRHMNKQSDNPETRLLFLQLGVAGMAANPQQSTRELAQREVRKWFAEAGIDTKGLVVDNGSGLSRSERIAPITLARMLQVAFNGKTGPDLLMSLPTAGIDGTLRRRLVDTAAQGWARLKTGTLGNAVALAGLVRDAEGRSWVLAAMVNAESAPRRGRPVLDALVNWMAEGGPMAAPRRMRSEAASP